MFRGRKACVFFAQHSLENRPNALWEGRFFIAPQVCSANVHIATEGASPCRAFRVGGSHQVDAKSQSGLRGARGSSIGAVALGGYGTLSQ